MKDIVIVSAARTAIGKFDGALREYEASDLGAFAIADAVRRIGIDKLLVDEVVMGCVGQVAENAFLARLCSIKAGIPVKSGALTVNRLCSSGLQAIVTAAMEIDAGFAEVCVAGGAESMTNIPFYLRNARFGYRMGDSEVEDGLVTALTDPFGHYHMGITAENVAEQYRVSREQQDLFALLSQTKAAKAIKNNVFDPEIVDVEITIGRKEKRVFNKDEHPREGVTLDSLSAMKPAFKPNGTVTAGNSSGINDAGAAVVMMKESKAKDLGLKPMVRIACAAVGGVEPEIMGVGPIPAVKKLLSQTGLSIDDIGLIELNEAFASQAIACIKELGMNQDRINVNGGAIALGHPIGATGAIISIKLIYEMRRRGERYGLVTMCIGGGQGLAVLYELC